MKIRREKRLNIKTPIMSLIKSKGSTQIKLAEEMGYSSQSGISQILSRGNIQLETLASICDVYDYEVTIQPKRSRGIRPQGQFVLEWEEEKE